MRSHRTINSKAIPLALALVCVFPAAARASSLLSGYGGPGQGNQAILGSAVVNGPTGGSGGGSGSTSAEATGSGSAPGGQGGTSAAGKHSSSGSAKRGGGSAGRSSAGAARTYPSYPSSQAQAASRSSSTGGTLGLSGADVLYILLALAALVLTGVLTMRLARRPQPAGAAAKGISRRTRLTE